MTPKMEIKEVLSEAKPNEPIKSTFKYGEELFSQSELKCMSSCTARLVMIENTRSEFDSILEFTAEQGKPTRGLNYIYKKTTGRPAADVRLFDNKFFTITYLRFLNQQYNQYY